MFVLPPVCGGKVLFTYFWPYFSLPGPSGPFSHVLHIIVRDCEPISGPQSGSLINHYILGSTGPFRMLQVTVSFCSLTKVTLLQSTEAVVTCALYPHWITKYPQDAWPKDQLPRARLLSFGAKLPEGFLLLWSRVLDTPKERFPPTQTICRGFLPLFFFFFFVLFSFLLH